MLYTPRHARNPVQRISLYAMVTTTLLLVLVAGIVGFLSATGIV